MSRCGPRYDLIEQVRRLRGADDLKRAWVLLQASWAVRLRDNPFGEGLNAIPSEQFEAFSKRVGEPKREDDCGGADVAYVKMLVEKIPTLDPADQRIAGHKLRFRGESDVLEKALPSLLAALSRGKRRAR
ncbi:MAG: hypothetical protein FJX76_15700 [Armatimonadetes bacterium]|nr:hypothetical protein [Armatimonadota bacterium]